MFGLGTNELIIIMVIVLVLFGGAKLPQLMKGMGEGMKEFKKATRDEDERPIPPSSIDTHNQPRI